MSRPTPATYSEENRLTELLNDAANACYNANATDVASYLARHFTLLSTTDSLYNISSREISDGCGGLTLQLSMFLAGDHPSYPSAVMYVSHSHGLTNMHPSASRVVATQNEKVTMQSTTTGNSTSSGSSRHVLGEPIISLIAETFVPALRGVSVSSQSSFDDTLIVADGTSNFYNLLGHVAATISMGAAVSASKKLAVPLYSVIARMKHHHVPSVFRAPLPIITLFSAEPRNLGKVRVREVTLLPLLGSEKLSEGISGCGVLTPSLLNALAVIYDVARGKMNEEGHAVCVNLDGALRYTSWENVPAVVDYVDEILKESGYQLGKDFGMGLTIDAALCYKSDTQRYVFLEGTEFSGGQLAEFLATTCKDKKHIVYLEDTHNDHDVIEMKRTMAKIGDCVTIAGNNLYAGNPAAIRKGVSEKLTNNCVIRLNDCGTVSSAIAAVHEFEKYENATVTIGSERFEGNPAFNANFAVGVGAELIHVGGQLRGDHAAVLNNLIQIASEIEAEGLMEEAKDAFNPQAIPQVELPPTPSEPVVEVTMTKDKKKK